jgi:hypothetical protein
MNYYKVIEMEKMGKIKTAATLTWELGLGPERPIRNIE